MSAEKMIRSEAKSKLSGNWVTALLSVILLIFPIMIAILLVTSAYAVLGEIELTDVFSEDPVRAVVFAALNLTAVAALLLLSPIYNGFVRFYAKLAAGEEADMTDVFRFFTGRQSFRCALVFMSGVLVRVVGILLVCEAPAIVAAIFSDDSDTIFYISIALAILGALGAFLWLHRFAFQMTFFSYYDYTAEDAARAGAAIAKTDTGKLIKLTISFIPWLIFTYLVVPVLYVYPYMTASYFVSIKYIINSYFEQAKSVKNPVGDIFGNADNNADNTNINTSENTSGSTDGDINADINKAADENITANEIDTAAETGIKSSAVSLEKTAE